MPFDSFVLNAVAAEIDEKIVTTKARINKIVQPNATDIVIFFRGEAKTPLLISSHPQWGRVHFTEHHYSRNISPPPFCMLLRKHLKNALPLSVEQPPLERVLYLHFSSLSEEGREIVITLAAEIMGRHSNIILLSPAEGRESSSKVIIGAVKSIPSSINRYRTILPHYYYYPPPKQQKLHPFALDYEYFHQMLSSYQGEKAEKVLLQNIQGLSPFLCSEIAARAKTDYIKENSIPSLWEKLQEIIKLYERGKWKPTLICDKDGAPMDYAALNTVQEEKAPVRRSFNSMSMALDEYYSHVQNKEEQKNLYALLLQKVEQNINKLEQKEKILLKELDETQKADYYRTCGDLLFSFLKDVPSSAGEVYLDNIFEPGKGKIKIPLDPSLSPSLNAQAYYKKYRKAQQGRKKIKEQLDLTRQEKTYLQSVLLALKNSDLQNLRETRDELQESGYLPPPSKKIEQKPEPSYKPMKFISSQNEEIYVGKNNRQNDYLVQQFAPKNALWFHVKDLPGAHVVVPLEDPQEETVKEAALLAAYFSKGASSANVPVDFTRIKYVKRIPKGKPGAVTYKNYRTLYVTPDEDLLNPLLNRKS